MLEDGSARAHLIAALALEGFQHAGTSEGTVFGTVFGWRLGLLTIGRGGVATFIDIHGAFGAAEFPESGAFTLVGEGEFTAVIEVAPDDHGEGVAHPVRRMPTGLLR